MAKKQRMSPSQGRAALAAAGVPLDPLPRAPVSAVSGMPTKEQTDLLETHCARHYRGRGRVEQIISRRNLLGEYNFAEVRFAGGSTATFCLGFDGTFWVRNESKARVR